MKLTLIIQYLIDKTNFKSTQTEHEIIDAKQFNDLYQFELICNHKKKQ
jgi:hypothetical protein